MSVISSHVSCLLVIVWHMSCLCWLSDWLSWYVICPCNVWTWNYPPMVTASGHPRQCAHSRAETTGYETIGRVSIICIWFIYSYLHIIIHVVLVYKLIHCLDWLALYWYSSLSVEIILSGQVHTVGILKPTRHYFAGVGQWYSQSTHELNCFVVFVGKHWRSYQCSRVELPASSS